MDTIFRKWQSRYGICEEAYHALWGILWTIEHNSSSKLGLHDPLPYFKTGPTRLPHPSGRLSETGLFQGALEEQEVTRSNHHSFIFEPGFEERFIAGVPEVGSFGTNLFVDGTIINSTASPSTRELQPFPGDLSFLP